MGGPRLLYVGDDGEGTTSRDRADALVKLGAQTTLLPGVTIPGLLGRVEWHIRARPRRGLSWREQTQP